VSTNGTQDAQETPQEDGPQRYIHLVLMMQDEVGQLKTVLDGRLKSVNVDRKDDGSGHIYGDFAEEIPREKIEAMVTEYQKQLETAEEEAPALEPEEPAEEVRPEA